MQEEGTRILKLRERLWDGLREMEEVYANGDLNAHIPGIINMSFNFVEGESLIMSLPELAVSSGSACTSASLEPSYVLRALGMNDELPTARSDFQSAGSPQKPMLTKRLTRFGRQSKS